MFGHTCAPTYDTYLPACLPTYFATLPSCIPTYAPLTCLYAHRCTYVYSVSTESIVYRVYSVITHLRTDATIIAPFWKKALLSHTVSKASQAEALSTKTEPKLSF